jgi:electron transport complex protein RnfB
MISLARRIDALLPQTQCTKCGFPACRPYADAIASAAAEINRCPPGGEPLIRKLAKLVERDYLPLDPRYGTEQARRVAIIDEARCIGCTLCIQACPVDAIVGAAKLMHTVVTELCSGCELCLPPCPVNCIEMVPAKGADAIWGTRRADAARDRFARRQARLTSASDASGTKRRPDSARIDGEAAKKRATILAAVERARARRAAARDR